MNERMNRYHENELNKFLTFFRLRLKTHLANVDADFEDACTDRLSSEDELYSQKDIKDMLSSLSFTVKANIRMELQDTINMSALLLRQVFSEAEQHSVNIALNLGSIEDRTLLDQVEQLSVNEWNANPNLSKLSSKAQAKIIDDPQDKQTKVIEELRMSLHTSQLQQEAYTKEIKLLQSKLKDAQYNIENLQSQVNETDQHISQSKQFIAMKKLIATKNDQLQSLRQRLQRYEPDIDANELKDED